MFHARELTAAASTLSLLLLTSCLTGCSSAEQTSSADAGAPGPGTPTGGLGSAVNDAWDLPAASCTGTVTGGTFSTGAFSVTVADGEISRCANATAPAAKAGPRPAELELRASDVLVTAGGESYRLDLGEKGFHTSKPGAVVARVPFDTSKVPADKRDGLHVFLRAHVPSDHAVVDVSGKVDGGVVTAELRGLPAALDVAVVYNPGMRAVAATAVPKKKAAAGHLTPEVWATREWCATYNPADPSVVAAASGALGVAGPPSLAEIDSVAKSRIAASAAAAAAEYEATGLRQPDLYVATTEGEPCGGTNPRFVVHWVQNGNFFKSFDPQEVVAPDGNHFGRVYISTGATNWTQAANGATVAEVVAHEMLHAIQAGYTLWGASMTGYKEGSSTSWGRTIALNAREAQVRSLGPETFMLSDFVMISTQPANKPTYSNQDFVAYVSRARSDGSPSWLGGLFSSLHDAVEAEAAAAPTPAAQDAIRWQPPRATLLLAMDKAFRTKMSTDLRSEYVEFLRERAFDHGPSGYFARVGETKSGFARELFAVDPDPAKSALFEATIDPVACTVTPPSFGFAAVAPLAARAVRLRPTTTTAAPVAIHFRVDGDGAGTKFGGVAKLGSVTQKLENETVVDGFGKTMDPLDFAVANLVLTERRDLAVRVTCEAMTDVPQALKTFTWPLGENGSFTIDTSVSGVGARVTSDETSTYAHVAEVELATKMPTHLGVTLRVTPPAPVDAGGVHTSYAVAGYAYTLKQPTEQARQEGASTMRFVLDGTTTKELGPQLYLFDVDVIVKVRTTSWYVDDEGVTQTASSSSDFVALALIAYVNVP